jgi:Uma2 family endonuclease
MALLKNHEEVWMTGDELFRRPDLGPCELVRGRIVALSPTGFGHGAVEAKLTTRLTIYAEGTGRGEVVNGEVGIFHDRLARGSSSSYLDVAPELVVEVLSPDDRWTDVTEKLEDYFSAGINSVWVLVPKLRRVLIYRSLTAVTQLDVGQILTDEEILPGFSVPVADLFPV